MTRLGLTRQEVLHSFEAELGAKVTPIGDISRARFDIASDGMAPSGQASFHLDLDISLLGVFGRNRHPRALVADAARGLDVLPAVLAHSRLFPDQFVGRGESGTSGGALLAVGYSCSGSRSREALPSSRRHAGTCVATPHRQRAHAIVWRLALLLRLATEWQSPEAGQDKNCVRW
jgi:hypothetical protein